jgi:hypothetical protein
MVFRWISPDDVKAIIRVVRSIVISKRLDDIVERIMLPTNQDVARTPIVLYDFVDAALVVSVARRIDGDTEILSQRVDGVVRSFARSIW